MKIGKQHIIAATLILLATRRIRNPLTSGKIGKVIGEKGKHLDKMIEKLQ